MCPEIRASNFDKADRKSFELATNHDAPVANATDSDWSEHCDVLERRDLTIELSYVSDPVHWFDS